MIWLFIAAGVCAADLGIKHYIETHKKENCHEPIADGHIIITRFHNPGAMLGWLKEKPRLLTGLTLCCMGALIGALSGSLYHRRSPLIKAGLALIVGGAASNAYDRLVKHQVTDYFRISIGNKKLERVIFNLGDIAIFIGTLVTIIGEMTSANT
jgi:signal peptidase II